MRTPFGTGRVLTGCLHPAGRSPVSYTHLDVYKRQGVDDDPRRVEGDSLAARGELGRMGQLHRPIPHRVRSQVGTPGLLLRGADRGLDQGGACLLYTSRCV